MIPSTTPIVLDSTVIIALSTVGRVDLLRWRVLIPEKVVDELSKDPARSTLVSLVKGGKAEVIKPTEELRKKALFILSDKGYRNYWHHRRCRTTWPTYSGRRKRTLEKA
jgi:hypothetical protein